MFSYLKRLVPRHYHAENWVQKRCDHLESVIAGPFYGLKYPDNELRPYFSARLLGTYEKELGDVIEEICKRNFTTIIDIGAAEGYYAVGLCLRCPQVKMIAFEIEEFKRKRLEETAVLNGVADRLIIKGECTKTDLIEALENNANALIICDIEGGERDLLNPNDIPGLLQATLLVELHDVFPEFADIPEVMQNSFSATHEFVEIQGKERTLKDLPFSVPFLCRKFYGPKLMARMDEKRPKSMHWYFMTPRHLSS